MPTNTAFQLCGYRVTEKNDFLHSSKACIFFFTSAYIYIHTLFYLFYL